MKIFEHVNRKKMLSMMHFSHIFNYIITMVPMTEVALEIIISNLLKVAILIIYYYQYTEIGGNTTYISSAFNPTSHRLHIYVPNTHDPLVRN